MISKESDAWEMKGKYVGLSGLKDIPFGISIITIGIFNFLTNKDHGIINNTFLRYADWKTAFYILAIVIAILPYTTLPMIRNYYDGIFGAGFYNVKGPGFSLAQVVLLFIILVGGFVDLFINTSISLVCITLGFYSLLMYFQSGRKRWIHLWLASGLFILSSFPLVGIISSREIFTRGIFYFISGIAITLNGIFDHYWLIGSLKNNGVVEKISEQF